MEKYGFRIRAHNGALLDHLIIQAQDADGARAKLLRMYPQCAILATWTEASTQPAPSGKSFEDIADIINHDTPGQG
jgi:hypothetical protein